MPPHPSTNLDIQKYYQKEPKFNGVYSRNNLPKTKDRAYVIYLDEYESIGTHWIALYVMATRASYYVIHFDSFGAENIPKDIKKFIENKNIITNIHTMHKPTNW